MENDFLIPPAFSIDLPNFDNGVISEYFGLWAIHDPTFTALVDRINGLNLLEHVASTAARDAVAKQSADYQITDEGVAVFKISGPMMKTVSSLSGGTSTVRIRQQLRSAANNPDVIAGILVMDTPGGTVRGNSDLAQSVAEFAKLKPIYAFTEDMTASAGVSVASQATKRFANSPQALYGSMGTYSVLTDQSGVADKVGVKVHVIRAGEFKGMGEPGTKITPEQLAEAQRVVNALNEGYLQLIATGLSKPIEQIRPIADGRIHTATDAKGMGLIDGIQSYDETYRQLVTFAQLTAAQRKSPTKTSNPPRSTHAMEKVAATLTDLKASFPNSTAEWRETQLEAGASMQEAAISYAKHVEAKAKVDADAHAKALADVKAKADEEAKKNAAKQSGRLGHDPLRQRAKSAAGDEESLGESGEPIEDFNAAVAKIAGPNPTLAKRQAAVRRVANRNPQLYQAFLLATNPGSRQQRMINEKLEATIAKN
jgi:signal peptide peptidase SppA